MQSTINQRFKDIRESKGLTQTEFANHLDTTRAVISQIEAYKQNPTVKLLITLATKYNIDYYWLLEGKGEMHKNTNSTVNYREFELKLKSFENLKKYFIAHPEHSQDLYLLITFLGKLDALHKITDLTISKDINILCNRIEKYFPFSNGDDEQKINDGLQYILLFINNNKSKLEDYINQLLKLEQFLISQINIFDFGESFPEE